MENCYYVYIATNIKNTVLYTGVTNNLDRRMYDHKHKTVKGFTEKYNINKLVYFETFNLIEDAILYEKKIKGWLRKKKIKLINEMNPKWRDLMKNSSDSSS